MKRALSAVTDLLKKYPFWFIFALGLLVRVFMFNAVPAGLNQDEASIGYDAWSILKFGIDRNGISFPVHLISWGSGQNALYAYFAMPFIAIFGLTSFSIRLVNLVFGLAALPAFYLLVKNISSRRLALVSFFLLAINPWHIMMNRWALESNLFPELFLFAALLLVLSFRKPWLFAAAAAVASLCLYAYGTAYFFVPLFCAAAFVYMAYHGKLRPLPGITGLILFVLIAVPIVIFIIINKFHLDSVSLGAVTIPALTGGARFVAMTGGSILSHAGELFKLMIIQNDFLKHNVISWFGFMYLISLPLTLLGFWPSRPGSGTRKPREISRPRRDFHPAFIMPVWLVSALLVGVISTININRLNILYFPLIYFTARGIIFFADRYKYAIAVFAAVYMLFFGAFAWTYFGYYRTDTAYMFNNGLDRAIKYAAAVPDKTVYLPGNLNMPYIQVLFNTLTPPREFIASAHFVNKKADFQQVDTFGRWNFTFNGKNAPRPDAVYIMNEYDAFYFDKVGFDETAFGKYHVFVPK